jgi:hypothetical protein
MVKVFHCCFHFFSPGHAKLELFLSDRSESSRVAALERIERLDSPACSAAD